MNTTPVNYEKYYNANGDVAVLISPGYGAGWSTWSTEHEEDKMFDRRIVEMVLAGDRDKINQELMTEFGYGEYECVLGASDLEIVFLPKGAKFRIDEYNGHESLITVDELCFTA